MRAKVSFTCKSAVEGIVATEKAQSYLADIPVDFPHMLALTLGLDSVGYIDNVTYDNGQPSNFDQTPSVITSPLDFINIYLNILKETANTSGQKSADLIYYFKN